MNNSLVGWILLIVLIGAMFFFHCDQRSDQLNDVDFLLQVQVDLWIAKKQLLENPGHGTEEQVYQQILKNYGIETDYEQKALFEALQKINYDSEFRNSFEQRLKELGY